MSGWTRALAVGALGLACGSTGIVAQELAVRSVSPARHALRAARSASIVVEFDRAVDRASVTGDTFRAFGRWSGAVEGTFAFADGDRRVTLRPQRPFSAGETVTVLLSKALRGADGGALRDAGYAWQFWVGARRTGLRFEEIDRFSTRSSPTVSSRAYGGFGSDLDGDGFLDLTIVNEDTNDLRTFLNRGDGSGLLRDFLRPTTRVGNVPSPSEPADFNGDGFVDIVVANTQGTSVSVLLGRGDGTFGPATHLQVGREPRGVTVLDADGDADFDIAATSFERGTVTVLFNDGRGRFRGREVFGTGDGERAIAAADMDDDGILDLVVGSLTAEEVHLYTGAGDGTYTLTAREDAGGGVWMLVLGDVDGDGTEDVATVNGRSDNAAILRGDGAGGLAPAEVRTIDDLGLAADLGDFDGDGDLDWVTSSFSGDWLLFENDGSGRFTQRSRFTAPQAASCSIPMDLDDDGALDLVLIDEIADEVVLMRNASGSGGGASGFSSDFESGGTSDWSRERGAIAVTAPGLRGSGFALDATADGTPARSFVESRHPSRESAWTVSFDVDVRGLGFGAGSPVDVDGLEILRLGARRPQAWVTLTRDGVRWRAHLRVAESGGPRSVGSVRLHGSGVSRLEVAWSADGRASIRRGRAGASVDDLENPGRRISWVRLGFPAGSVGASGVLRLDGYESGP